MEEPGKPSHSSDRLTLGDGNERAAKDHRATAAAGGGCGPAEGKGHESGVAAVLPLPGRGGAATGGSGEEESSPGSSSRVNFLSASSQTAAEVDKVPFSSTAPAATVEAKTVVGAAVVPDVPSEARHNSGLGKLWLWPSTSSSSGRSKDEDAAAGSTTDVVGTQPVTSGAILMNDGVMEGAKGAAGDHHEVKLPVR